MDIDLADAYPAPGYQRWVLLVVEEGLDAHGIPGPFGCVRVIYGEPATENPQRPALLPFANEHFYPQAYILLRSKGA